MTLLSLTIAFVVPTLLLGQTVPAKSKSKPADTLKAEALFGEALALHKDGKCEAALAKIKEAAALVPTNPRFESYRADLEQLVGKDELERHALAAPREAEESLEALAHYLSQGARDDRSKARAIYRWVTDRISYDFKGLLSGRIGDNSAEAVLKSRVGVCAGYASLYLELGKHAGLDVVQINGYAKGFGYVPGEKMQPNHAWNAVKLDGQWHLIDATWGAGSVNGAEYKQFYRPDFFLVPPEEFIFMHLPDDPKWQLLSVPVTPEEFAPWPRVSAKYFRAGLAGTAIRTKLAAGGKLVEMFDVNGPQFKIIEAPLDQALHAGTKYKFRLAAPAYLEVVVLVDGKPQPLVRKGDTFGGEIVATKGELKLLVKASNSRSYDVVCRYRVD